MRVPSQVLDAVRNAGNVVLATHISPDGDAVGSLLGMSHILGQLGKNVFAYFEQTIPPMYRFLPGCAVAETDLGKLADFVAQANGDILTVALDCGDAKRLGENRLTLMAIQPLLVIDHHQKNEGFGQIAWIEPERSSTGEMVYDLAVALGVEISTDMGECLYAAISSDTGSFRYESTSEYTLGVARELLRAGVRPEKISTSLFENYTLGRLQLLQEVLSTLEIHSKEQIAVIRVTQNMLERTFTTMTDTEQFVNMPRSIHSVKVAVFLKEVNEHLISVSLRAKGECNVSDIAADFDGGGHRNASGFRFHNKSLDEVRDLVVARVKKALV